MSVSFTSNSLSVINDTTMTYTVQKGNTLCTLAKEIAEETGRSYKECYTDLLRQNDFKDAELNPEGTRDPNLIYAKSAKHEADVLKFTVDAEAKGKLSSFCMSSAPTADAAAAARDAEAGVATVRQGARFAERPPVYACSEPVPSEGIYGIDDSGNEVCEEEVYAERFYTDGEYGVEEFTSEDEAYASLTCDDDTVEDSADTASRPADGVIDLDGEETADADYSDTRAEPGDGGSTDTGGAGFQPGYWRDYPLE